jgi:hypothetical protein
MGRAAAMAHCEGRTPGRVAVLRHRRTNPRATVVSRRSPRRVPPGRRSRWCQAPVRAPSATPRARARTRPRGRAAEHHPAPARPYQPRDHLHVFARDRSRGDHQCRAGTPRADDVRQRRTPALKRQGQRGRYPALPLRPGEASACRACVQTIVAPPSRKPRSLPMTCSLPFPCSFPAVRDEAACGARIGPRLSASTAGSGTSRNNTRHTKPTTTAKVSSQCAQQRDAHRHPHRSALTWRPLRCHVARVRARAVR